MSKRPKDTRHGPRNRARAAARTPSDHGRGAARVRSSGRGEKRPILRFVLFFALLVIPFNLYYYASFADSGAFQAYLRLNARASAAVIGALGTEVSARDRAILSPRWSMQIARGCDAIQPTALFICAILAAPAPWRSKGAGLLIGAPILLGLNLVRIVTLFYTGVYWPDLFEIVHIDIWQAAFIFLALLFWVLWARRAVRAANAHATQ
ncbi:MAG: archaeosortase/exosortase family protein [Phycisphaerae bacterium]